MHVSEALPFFYFEDQTSGSLHVRLSKDLLFMSNDEQKWSIGGSMNHFFIESRASRS